MLSLLHFICAFFTLELFSPCLPIIRFYECTSHHPKTKPTQASFHHPPKFMFEISSTQEYIPLLSLPFQAFSLYGFGGPTLSLSLSSPKLPFPLPAVIFHLTPPRAVPYCVYTVQYRVLLHIAGEG